MKLGLLVSADPAGDAILDYSCLLAHAVESYGVECVVVDVGPLGRRRSDLHLVRGCDWLVVQYNPFAFGRHGIAPWLPGALRRAKRDGPRIALTVHEPFVPWGRFYFRMLWAPQRAQYAACARLADVLTAPTELWCDLAGRLGPRPVHVPVGSNLPDRRGARNRARAAMGADQQTLVISTYGSDHPSRHFRALDSWFAAAVAAHDGPAIRLILGSGTWTPSGVAAPTIHPGRLPGADLAELLSASDLFLSAHVDGASLRRGTMASALGHELAVVALNGRGTDDLLRRELGTVLVSDVHRGVERVSALAADPSERRMVASLGHAFFERHLTWEIIAGRLTDLLHAQAQK